MMGGRQAAPPKEIKRASKYGDPQSKAARDFIQAARGSSDGQHEGYKKAVRRYIEDHRRDPVPITSWFRKGNFNALYSAIACNGDVEMVSMLLDAGFQVNEMCHLRLGSTPLMCVASSGKLDIAKLLVERGADLFLVDKNGKTAEQCAVDNKQFVVASFLKQKREELTQVKKAPTRADDLTDVGVGNTEVDPLFCCPLSRQVMQEPVTVSTGATYDRASLLQAFINANNPESIPCVVVPGKIIHRHELNNGVNIAMNALIKKYVNKKVTAAEMALSGPEVEVKSVNSACSSQGGFGLFASSGASSGTRSADLDNELVGPDVQGAVTIHPPEVSWPEQLRNPECRAM